MSRVTVATVRTRVAQLLWLACVVCALVLAAGALTYALDANPDNALVEYAGNHPAERFNHVHFIHDDPFCAQLWYQRHLGATVFAGRTSETPNARTAGSASPSR